MSKSPTEFEPSELDELTHAELRMMHANANSAILFSKSVQWLSIGLCWTLFCVSVFVKQTSPSPTTLTSLLLVTNILLACATVFLIFMYQLWQFNEIKRIRIIEKQFSTLCRQVHQAVSVKERGVERYTILVFMIALVIAGATVSLILIR